MTHADSDQLINTTRKIKAAVRSASRHCRAQSTNKRAIRIESSQFPTILIGSRTINPIQSRKWFPSTVGLTQTFSFSISMADGAEWEAKKIIIDTDPGIDDAMAIFVALQSPEVQVIGITTIYGNVYTTLATRNALHLLEVAGRTDIPVAEGSHVTITKGTKLRIADFVHGVDGLGNQNFPPPKGKPIEQSAAAFLVEQASLYPGKATQLDPAFAKNIGQIILLGGAFAVNGNVNPAAEANIFGDPDAADMVFTCGADILAMGINVTHQVVLTGTMLRNF
ncbi:unnamed protein product [Malus baccata var. baccata]